MTDAYGSWYDRDSYNDAEKQRLIKLIQDQEAVTGTRSPLRDVIPDDVTTEGVDQPVISVDARTLPEKKKSLVEQLAEAEGPKIQQQLQGTRNLLPDALSTIPRADQPVPGTDYHPPDILPSSVREAASGVLGNTIGMPWQLFAGVEATPELVGYQGNRPAINYALQKAKEAREFGDFITGAKPAEPGKETLARLVGESFLPAGKATTGLTALVTGGRELTNWLNAPPEESVTHTDNAPKPPESVQGPEWLESALPMDNTQWSFVSPAEAAAKKKKEAEGKDVAHQTIIDAVGGPINVSDREFSILGGLTLASIGMIFAPTMFSKFQNATLPRFRTVLPMRGRPVEDAPVGTIALSRPSDLGRTYDDINAGLIAIARRELGTTPDVVDHLERTFGIQTRGAAKGLADSAVETGNMDTPIFRFRVPTPLVEIARADSPIVNRYMHLLDTFDDLNMPNAPRIVRGLSLPDVLGYMTQIERGNPGIQQISAAYKQNLRETRRFASTGEFATMTKVRQNDLNGFRPNEVPWQGSRVLGDPVERGSAFESLAGNIRSTLQFRMENEARGMYVDAVRNEVPDAFKLVTNADLKANPNWRKNTVTIYRRGKAERYATDPLIADVMNADPYFLVGGMVGQAAYSTKRLLEMGSTGLLAPSFSIKSSMRNFWISKFTAVNSDLQAPSILGWLAAPAQQLAPQISRIVARGVEAGSAGWIPSVFGTGNTGAMANRMSQAVVDWLDNVHDQSWYNQMRRVGNVHGSVMEQQVVANSRLAQAADVLGSRGSALLNGYKAILDSVHNAPQFAFTRRNQGAVPNSELAYHARRLTGDPRMGGQYYRSPGENGGSPVPIRFESDPYHTSAIDNIKLRAVKRYGQATELGRESAPWFNATLQGMKEIGRAYLTNPFKFTMNMWKYAVLPSAGSYLMARSMGEDPNGQSYVDYMMNRRNSYTKTMNWYIPIPGQPAENGIEYPKFQEMSLASLLAEIGLDHAFRSAIFSQKEDFTKALHNFLGVTVEPPLPPLFNVAMAMAGKVGPQGMFGGEGYSVRNPEFDQLGGLPHSIELYVRALSGGVSSIIGPMAAAWTNTKSGVLDSFKNTLTEGGKQIVSRAPVINNLVGVLPPISGNTEIVNEIMDKRKAIGVLDRYYKEWVVGKGQIGTNTGASAEGRSSEGGELADTILGYRTPLNRIGAKQPPPTNPIYIEFMQELHNTLSKDRPVYDADGSLQHEGDKGGGIGLPSYWQRFNQATRHIRSLRQVNEGNATAVVNEIRNDPEQMQFLKLYGVSDPSNIREVRNLFERVRDSAGRSILKAIRSVEEDMSTRIGQPFKLEDLNPYGKGIEGAPDITDPDYE